MFPIIAPFPRLSRGFQRFLEVSQEGSAPPAHQLTGAPRGIPEVAVGYPLSRLARVVVALLAVPHRYSVHPASRLRNPPN
jgi:hypothetical protein